MNDKKEMLMEASPSGPKVRATKFRGEAKVHPYNPEDWWVGDTFICVFWLIFIMILWFYTGKYKTSWYLFNFYVY